MNDIHFKIQFDCKHEGGHYFKVKYNWINTVSPTEFGAVDEETTHMKDWNLVQIEGEEKVDEVVEEAVADKKVDPKAKKGAPAKGATQAKVGGALEEITDNRPR